MQITSDSLNSKGSKRVVGTLNRNGSANFSSTIPFVSLLGIEFAAISESECVETVIRLIKGGQGGNLLTMNLDHTRRYFQKPATRPIYDGATIRVADGMPLVWGSRLLGHPLPERVTGSNLIWSLTKAAANADLGIFLLGGNPGTAERTADLLRQQSPHLNVVGICCPKYGFETSEEQVNEIYNELIEKRPDIVYLAIGSPREERFALKLRAALPQAWIVGVGISFSFVCGEIQRAPAWMQMLGLEWLFRLLQEPKRLFKRYIVNGIPFFFQFMGRILRERWRIQKG